MIKGSGQRRDRRSAICPLGNKTMYKCCWLLCFSLAMQGSLTTAQETTDKSLRLNQMQVVGTHNSYHLRPPAAMLKAAIAQRAEAKEWDYSRQPLDQQLDQGVRSFELDLHLSDKGWQVMHVPAFDAGTTVPTFTEALRVIRSWSEAHPRHIPISILLELKEEGFQLNRSFRRPKASDLARLDEEIRQFLSPERMLTPDDVRGRHKTLWEAVHAEGWPTLAEAAGKVLVILHEKGPNRDAYLDGHPSLEGRAMFVESDVGQPHSAVLIRNNPTDPEIDGLAREGYLIRTRADTQGDLRPARRERALAGGAHVLTTDFPCGEIEAERAFGLPDRAPARVNPVTGPEKLRGTVVGEPIP
jgi:hypothetical protein